MAAPLVNFVGKRILKESATNHFGQEDPYFEEVPAERLGRAFGRKTKKRRKALPPGLSGHDAKVLTKVKRRAYRLDYSLFSLCGVRFGWGSVIGLLPVVGDAFDAFLALLVIRTCHQVEGGLPAHLTAFMYINLIIDFAVGLVPFAGDIVDAIYKCNTRNAVLLERHLRNKNKPKNKRQGSSNGIDPSLPEEFDKDEEQSIGDPPPYSSAGHQSSGTAGGPNRPEPARVHDNRGGERTYFGGSRNESGTGASRHPSKAKRSRK